MLMTLSELKSLIKKALDERKEPERPMSGKKLSSRQRHDLDKAKKLGEEEEKTADQDE